MESISVFLDIENFADFHPQAAPKKPILNRVEIKDGYKLELKPLKQ